MSASPPARWVIYYMLYKFKKVSANQSISLTATIICGLSLIRFMPPPHCGQTASPVNTRLLHISPQSTHLYLYGKSLSKCCCALSYSSNIIIYTASLYLYVMITRGVVYMSNQGSQLPKVP